MDVSRPAHLEALAAAEPRNLDMLQGAAAARLLPEQPLTGALVEAASAAFVGAIDDSHIPTTKLYLQRAAQAADEGVAPNNFQHDDDDSEPTVATPRRGRLSAPSTTFPIVRRNPIAALQKKHLLAKGTWQQVTRIDDLCHTHVSHKCWLCPTTARLLHQRALLFSSGFVGYY